MNTEREGLSEKQKAAACMLGYGSTYEEVIKEVPVCRASLYIWRQQPEFTALVNKYCNEYLGSLKSRAVKKLDQQLGGKGTWLVADAVKTVFNRADKLEGLTDSRITISFGDAVADPGTPDTAYEDDVPDGQIDE